MSTNRLKKVVAVALCAFICIFGSSMVCSATQQRYTIPEIDEMTLYLPDNMTAITRSSPETDRYFSVFGLDYNTTMQNFQNGDIYLQGMDNMSGIIVTVTMTKTTDSKGIGNYNLLKTEELSEVTNNFLGQSEYTSCTPDSAGDIVWLNFSTHVNNNSTMIKAYQANTVYDGMSVNVTLQRNNGDVTAEDYSTLESIVSSVTFAKSGSVDNIIPYIIIGAGIVAIIIIILVIVLVKKAKKRRKKNKNDKIIEELAGKYTNRRNNANYAESNDYEDIQVAKTVDVDENNDDFFKGVESEEVKEYKPKPVDKVSEYEIDEILGYAETKEENFISDVSEKFENVSSSSKPIEEVVEQEAAENKPQENIEEDVQDFEPDVFEEFDEEEEEYYNDEELVRQASKRTKFNDSDDFFEEAPKKIMGVISSKDIRDAEDYDVINEVEKRVSEVEKSNASVGENVLNVFKKIGGGIKSFAVHFGYFCTNVSRMIKRRNAQKKRQKAEEERRERARLRAAKERQQRREMQNGGLVQVHRRNDRRPTQNGRPSSQRRPSQSGNRRPNGNNRRR